MKPSQYRTLHNQCDVCSSFFNLIVHHIDEDRSNNTYDNFKILCTSCHAIIHTRIANIKKMRYLYLTDYNQLTFRFYKI